MDYISIIEPIVFLLAGLIALIAILSPRKQETTRLQAALKKINQLSERMEKQEMALHKQQCLYERDKRLSNIQTKYPIPQKAWMNYSKLKMDIDTLLDGWITDFEVRSSLSEREVQFCLYYMVYSNLTLENIATHMCYSEKSIRNYKYRIAKKLGLPSAELSNYLQEDLLSYLITKQTSVCN